MKLSVVSVIVLSVVSVSSFANQFDDAEKAANNARAIEAKADARALTTSDAYNSPARLNADLSFNDKVAQDADAAEHAALVAHQNTVRANANVSGMALRNQITEQQQALKNYGTKGNINLASQVSPINNTQKPAYLGTSIRPATSVVVTKNPPFAGQHWGNARGKNNGSNGHSGTGNGSNNAANSHSAHGLGGGDHIGGGRSGGSYHY